MLSVNRILIFLFLGIFSSSLYAVDVSKFDIKGIKLGMNKNEVLKKMPCKNPEIDYEYVDTINGRKTYNTKIYCQFKKGLFVDLNHYNEVYKIKRIKYFNTEPFWSKIKKQLLNHYGNIRNIIIQPVTSNNKLALEMCIGECIEISNTYGKHYKTSNNKSSLKVSGETYDESFLTFVLFDPKKTGYEWKYKQDLMYKKQQKEKASNIDF